MYKQTTLTKIEDNLELVNFKWSINSVRYDWAQDKAFVEVHMKEDGKTITHSRTFEFDTSGQDWDSDKPLTEILAHSHFSGSTSIGN